MYATLETGCVRCQLECYVGYPRLKDPNCIFRRLQKLRNGLDKTLTLRHFWSHPISFTTCRVRSELNSKTGFNERALGWRIAECWVVTSNRFKSLQTCRNGTRKQWDFYRDKCNSMVCLPCVMVRCIPLYGWFRISEKVPDRYTREKDVTAKQMNGPGLPSNLVVILRKNESIARFLPQYRHWSLVFIYCHRRGLEDRLGRSINVVADSIIYRELDDNSESVLD